MHPNAELIARLYTALNEHDGETMAACYHPEATFSDPVFPSLKGEEVGNMWRMLCTRSDDLAAEFSKVIADDDRGSAHWEATYTFSGTGNKVHNIIDAELTFKDGLILTHRDRFDLWRWTGMALGLKGRLLGWTPLVQNKIRDQAAAGLGEFVKKRG